MPRQTIYCAFLLFVWTFASVSTLSAQNSSLFDKTATAVPLEFLNQGQAAGDLTFRFQDSRDFIWGADRNGRPIRFDGNQIEIFEHDSEDTTSASPGKLWDITCSFFEDSRGKIWIAYSTGGYLDCFDPVTEQFQRFRSRMENACDLSSHHNVRKVSEDRQGRIWIPRGQRLFRYDPSTNVLRCFEMPYVVTLVFEDVHQKMWVNFQLSTLAQINLETGAIEKKVAYPEGHKPWINKNWGYVNPDRHYQLKGKNIHLLSIMGWLYEFDADKEKIEWLHKSPLPKESLFYSFFAKDDLVLLATLSGLVFQYHVDTKTFSLSPLFPQSQKDVTQGYHEPFLIFQSAEDIIWANVYQGKNKEVKNIQFFPQKLALSKIPFPDEYDTLRLSVTRLDYCFLFNDQPYFLTHPWITPFNNDDAKGQKIDLSLPNLENHWDWTYHFKTAPDGHLWQAASPVYGTPNLIIREYDKDGKLLNQYTRNRQDTTGYPGGTLRDIQIDANGKIWLLSMWGGVSRFDPIDSSFTNFSAGLDGERPYVLDMLIDPINEVWAAGQFGVKKLDQKNKTWESVIVNEKSRSLFRDSKGNIWFCTENELGVMDSLGRNLRRYGIEKGFTGGGYNVFEDHLQRIWVNTHNELFLYNERKDNFLGFGQKEGVFLNGVHNKPIVWDSVIILPGIFSEVYLFKPQKLNIESDLPDLYFTTFQLSNKKVKPSKESVLEKGLDYAEHIHLEYAKNDFTIHYTAPEFTYPDRLQFITRMEGFNDDWQNLGNKREVRYTNLSPGQYTFQVKVRNHLGYESPSARSLKFTILPPWYRTWWAYGLYAFLIGSLSYWFYRFQLGRRLAEAEANRQKDLHQTKSRLFTNITHEFRTPLTIILGMADQVKSDPQHWFNEGMHLIRRNGKQLLNLVNQMLDLSKLESGNMKLNLINGDLIAFVRYLLESFHSYADSKDIRLHFLSDFKRLDMDYDPEKLQNIISNLLSNSIKFTPAGGDVYLEIRPSPKSPEELIILVKDNGLGIEAEHLPHIFDRFFQVDASTTRQGEGTGIGLALTKELVLLMGGTIEVQSELQEGTLFSIMLPITQNAQNQEEVVPSPSKVQEKIVQLDSSNKTTEIIPRSDNPLILLIEDNPDVITYLTSFLSNEYRVETASDGQAGIDKAIELIPDLVVSDVMMPKKDGYEVCLALKQDERTSHIPIILLTAKSDQGAKLEGLAQGADAYLAKPFQKEELMIRIEQLIQLRKQLMLVYQGKDFLANLSQKEQPTQQDIFLNKIKNIVEENISDEHFGLPELCKKAHLSRSQLFRKLKALTGKPTSHFIRSIRLAKAKGLLLSTDNTIAEIAFKVGFSNATYFAKSFKEEFGKSPSELRKK